MHTVGADQQGTAWQGTQQLTLGQEHSWQLPPAQGHGQGHTPKGRWSCSAHQDTDIRKNYQPRQFRELGLGDALMGGDGLKLHACLQARHPMRVERALLISVGLGHHNWPLRGPALPLRRRRQPKWPGDSHAALAAWKP